MIAALGITDGVIMDAVGLNRALDALGWSGVDLANRTGSHVNSVSAWRTGKARVPGPVAAYLKLMLGLAALVR